ncbi:MAG TPA: hypothetical protein VK524_07215 [Polyangiaceae bacterium]|nr:hypothetical protein [Polyangiaceae bacterium]
MQVRKVQLCFVRTLLAAPLIAASGPSQAADANWVHPMNQAITYYMPGPPPGPELGFCRVETKIASEPSGAVATIRPIRSSACKPGSRGAWVQVVAVDPGVQLVNGPWGDSTDDWPGMSVGPSGLPAFGAHFGAVNAFGYTLTWSVAFVQ